jgi:hypothetical protein
MKKMPNFMKSLLEQCSLTGGRQSSLAMSVFFIFRASSMDFPLIISVANELDAMADPQPNVLNLASIILPSWSTLIFKIVKNEQNLWLINF